MSAELCSVFMNSGEVHCWDGRSQNSADLMHTREEIHYYSLISLMTKIVVVNR